MLKAHQAYYALVLGTTLYLPLLSAARMTTSPVRMPLQAAPSAETCTESKAMPNTRTPPVHKAATTDDEIQLWQAIHREDALEVERLLKLGVSPYVYHNGLPAFACAIFKGNCTIIQLLLDHGAHPNDICYCTHPALPLPLKNAPYFISTCLTLNNDNFPKLPVTKHVEVIQLLITYGASLKSNQTQPHYDPSPLLLMVLNYPHPVLISLLLSLGASPRERSYKGKTALSICVQHVRPLPDPPYDISYLHHIGMEYSELETTIKLLLDAGCDPMLCDRDGQRAVDCSTDSTIRCLLARYSQHRIIKVLLTLHLNLPPPLQRIIFEYMKNDYEDMHEADFRSLRLPKQNKQVCRCIIS